ncbi:hypothetical protein ACTHS6_00400 [Neisseria sp. P0016.S006]|uniref:hypothetical protein n=1 Tax=Neisseria sp. P0016.S006 TaxID=3436772 RepID=UPI003F818E05
MMNMDGTQIKMAKFTHPMQKMQQDDRIQSATQANFNNSMARQIRKSCLKTFK